MNPKVKALLPLAVKEIHPAEGITIFKLDKASGLSEVMSLATLHQTSRHGGVELTKEFANFLVNAANNYNRVIDAAKNMLPEFNDPMQGGEPSPYASKLLRDLLIELGELEKERQS